VSDTVLIDGARVTVLPSTVRAMVVHGVDACAGRECVIHAPTDHRMRGFRLHWRADRGIFERLCRHGIGHPDPDQQAYWREQAERGVMDEAPDDESGVVEHWRTPDEHVSAQMTHGCDGCCS
jgi:hypothetical protein